MGRDCLLQCENNGYCEFVSDSVDQLRKIVQTGGLIQKCRCPLGWGGVVCEIPTENCQRHTQTCEISGRPCDPMHVSFTATAAATMTTTGNDQDNALREIGMESIGGVPTTTSTPATTNNNVVIETQWSCHCGIADRVDPNIAGTVCRKGYTEYCNPHPYHPDSPLYFCTNGGKCNVDYLAAQEQPGDLNVREQYMDAGCRCNDHFEGPHCERLIFDPNRDLPGLVDPARGFFDPSLVSSMSTTIDDENDNDDNNGMSTAGTVFLSVVLVGTVVGLALYATTRYKKHRLTQQQQQQQQQQQHSSYKYNHPENNEDDVDDHHIDDWTQKMIQSVLGRLAQRKQRRRQQQQRGLKMYDDNDDEDDDNQSCCGSSNHNQNIYANHRRNNSDSAFLDSAEPITGIFQLAIEPPATHQLQHQQPQHDDKFLL
ncbi:hypothetical protein ACA910_009184 [Epithemia clementina (nom. ined.)]